MENNTGDPTGKAEIGLYPSGGGQLAGPMKDMQQDMEMLIRQACLAGATEIRQLSPSEIVVDERLVRFCSEPRCENYGLSSSCPPHVAGPEGFSRLREHCTIALVVRLEVPSAVLFSNERKEVMRFLHEIVAGIERSAVQLGYIGSKAFAGGSCKDLFCHDKPVCRVVSGQGACRNPSMARPSMSGFGINVGKMMESAGWPATNNTSHAGQSAEAMTWVAGLVMIG